MTRNELYNMFDEMIELLGGGTALEELLDVLTIDELEANLTYICDNYEINCLEVYKMTRSELYNMFEEMTVILGEGTVLDELLEALTTDELEANLKYICDNYEISHLYEEVKEF